jgi:ABC-type glutathione transport system ATPase component
MSDAVAPLLQVTGLSHTFHLRAHVARKLGTSVVQAVRNVSLEVQSGQTLAIVGESGSGKSTLARCVTGVYEASEGLMRLNGKEYTQSTLRGRSHLRRQIQMVFQDPSSSLNPRHRIGRILSEPLRAHGAKNKKELAARVRSLLEDVGLPPEAASRYPHEFSGGQRQRIAIARALSLQPQLMICDEAVSALDVSVQGQVLNLLRRLQREHGLAYLFISHDMAVVRHIADRVAVMFQGEIVEQGAVDDVFHNPQDPYTKRLLDAVPRGLRAEGSPGPVMMGA